jgi:hypothetical protein
MRTGSSQQTRSDMMDIPSRSDLARARAEGETARTAAAAADAARAATAAEARILAAADKSRTRAWADEEKAKARAVHILSQAGEVMSKAAAGGEQTAVLWFFASPGDIETAAPGLRLIGSAALAFDIVRERMAASGYEVAAVSTGRRVMLVVGLA